MPKNQYRGKDVSIGQINGVIGGSNTITDLGWSYQRTDLKRDGSLDILGQQLFAGFKGDRAMAAPLLETKADRLESLLKSAAGPEFSWAYLHLNKARKKIWSVFHAGPDQSIRQVKFRLHEMNLDEQRQMAEERQFKYFFNNAQRLQVKPYLDYYISHIWDQLQSPSSKDRPSFSVTELTYRSPVIHPPSTDDRYSSDVHARYFLPKTRDGKPVPAVVVCSFGDMDTFASVASIYLANQGIAVLDVTIPLYVKRFSLSKEGASTQERYKEVGLNAEMFKGILVQAMADTSVAVRWLAHRPEIDPARLAVAGVSMNASIASTQCLFDGPPSP